MAVRCLYVSRALKVMLVSWMDFVAGKMIAFVV